MRKRWTALRLFGFSSGLSLLGLTPARADFLIQFTDGGQVIVHHYAEEGQFIKIYTPHGMISFRKAEVQRINEVDTSQSMRTPLEAVSAVPPASAEVSPPAPSGSQHMPNSDKTPKPAGGNTTKATATATTTVERLDGEYQEVTQEFNRLWDKHLQDINSGASEELLSDNRAKLNQLSNQRHKLIEEARQGAPEMVPAWAQ